jgi:hypothetical protein
LARYAVNAEPVDDFDQSLVARIGDEIMPPVFDRLLVRYDCRRAAPNVVFPVRDVFRRPQSGGFVRLHPGWNEVRIDDKLIDTAHFTPGLVYSADAVRAAIHHQ